MEKNGGIYRFSTKNTNIFFLCSSSIEQITRRRRAGYAYRNYHCISSCCDSVVKDFEQEHYRYSVGLCEAVAGDLYGDGFLADVCDVNEGSGELFFVGWLSGLSLFVVWKENLQYALYAEKIKGE